MRNSFSSGINRATPVILLLILTILMINIGYSAEARWIRVGNLHNFYQAHGCEPEEDFGDIQQWGLRWPAFWELQDMQAAKGFWIGAANFYDPVINYTFPYKVAHCGPRPRPEIEENEMMPVKFELIAYKSHPTVLVDGEISSDNQWEDLIDNVDETLPSDRMIHNIINSSLGISMDRKIYGFSQQYHDNFFIYDMTFTNNGICGKDIKDELITHANTLEDVYFYWQYRNAVCAEGTVEGTTINWIRQPGWGTERNMRWGKNTMNEVLGENPDAPAPNDVSHNGELIRCFYSWHGKHSASEYDNIGSPNYNGWQSDGRLGASQYTGVVTLHADKSPDDHSNDPYQPRTTMYINSDESATVNNDQYSQSRMNDEYTRLMAGGHPPLSQAEEVGDGDADSWKDGSYSAGIGFGPYTLAPGDSVRIVLAEGVNGLSRKMNTEVGRNWYKAAKLGQSLTFELPDGSSTTDEDEYKNAWVYTGVDSILKTFRRAIDLYNNDLILPHPPDPPETFEVSSQGNRIYLTWTDNAENSDYFEGYKLYRAKGKADSTYYEIFDCNKTDGNIVHEYSDLAAERGQLYFYYIISYDNGTQPGAPGVLRSSLFYTRTNKGATLKKPPAITLDDIRVVPNPYNIRNLNHQYIGEPNKIMFLNLPDKCEIKIYTERGDLIYEIDHEGSGDNKWNLITSSRQIVVSGVYIATFYVPGDIVDNVTGELIIKKGTSSIKKFVVIR